MKLKTAILIFATLILIVFALLSALLIRTTNLLEQEATDLEMAGESISLAKELESRLLTHNRNAFLYSIDPDADKLTNRRAQRVELERLLEVLERLISNGHEASILEDVEYAITTYLERRRQLSDSTFTPVEQHKLSSGNVDKAVEAIRTFVELNRTQMDELLANINHQNKAADRMAILLLLIGGALLAVVIISATLNIVRPLLALNHTISLYSAGGGNARADNRGFREIREVAFNFNSMADRLEERRQDQLRFIASIAHDLRNPLSSMSVASELLTSKEGEDRKLASIIYNQVRNLDRLVKDLLDTTRIEAGQLELDFSEMDLGLVIRDAVELQQTGLNLHKFQLRLPECSLICRGDQGRIAQVIHNLLSNAVKYSPEGGIIEIRAWSEQKQLVFSVADQGIGIASEDLTNIFRPFHRTKATKGIFPGIGLGLSSSRRIVEAHGGKMRVVSTPGKGSIFYVTLPEEAAEEVKL